MARGIAVDCRTAPHACSALEAPRIRAVARAMQYIDTHLCEPITVTHLATAACMSRFHFARVFRDVVGASPMEYLRRRRIERAQALLREGRHKISQIASELCFFDQSHFVRSFRHATGCTPARFAAQTACTTAHSTSASAPRAATSSFSPLMEHHR